MPVGSDQFLHNSGMAAKTDGGVVSGGFLASGYVVRVVAGGAQHRRIAFLKAGRLTQPVGRVGDFELVVVPGFGRLVEMQRIVCQRLARPVREDAARVTSYGGGQPETGGFQMTLHAQLQLPLPAQTRRVYDCSLRCFPALHSLDVGAPGAMAALAIDATRNGAAKYRS